MSMIARVVSVETERIGSVLRIAATAGDTTIYVEDITSFGESGENGTLLIGAETINYTVNIDSEADTEGLDLVSALAGSHAVDVRVYVSPAKYRKIAVVTDGENEMALPVASAPWVQLADGPRNDGAGELVRVEIGWVTSVLGQVPNVLGEYIVVGDIPILDDGLPPPDPTVAPTVSAGLGAIFVSWSSYSPPNDVEHYVLDRDQNDGNWASVATVTGRATRFYFDESVVYGTSYRYRFSVVDLSGKASGLSPVSTVVSPAKIGNIDLDANAVDTINLIDSSITGAKISALAVGTAHLAAGAATVGKIVIPTVMVAGLTLNSSTGAWSGATVWHSGVSYAITNNSPGGGTSYIYWTEGQTVFQSSAASPTGPTDHIIAHKAGATWEVVWHRGLAGTIIDQNHISVGAVVTEALAAGAVTAAKIYVLNLAAISANLGEVTAGTVTGLLIRTAASGERVELYSSSGGGWLDNYDSTGTLRSRLYKEGLRLLTSGGIQTGGLLAGDAATTIDVQQTSVTDGLIGGFGHTSNSPDTDRCGQSLQPAATGWFGAVEFYLQANGGRANMTFTVNIRATSMTGAVLSSGRAFAPRPPGTAAWLKIPVAPVYLAAGTTYYVELVADALEDDEIFTQGRVTNVYANGAFWQKTSAGGWVEKTYDAAFKMHRFTADPFASMLSSLFPDQDNKFDLGSGSYRWKTLYAGAGDFSDNISLAAAKTVDGVDLSEHVAEKWKADFADVVMTALAQNTWTTVTGSLSTIALVGYARTLDAMAVCRLSPATTAGTVQVRIGLYNSTDATWTYSKISGGRVDTAGTYLPVCCRKTDFTLTANKAYSVELQVYQNQAAQDVTVAENHLTAMVIK